MTIQVMVQLSIAPENLAKFQEFVADATAMVRAKEAGRTLTYDFLAAGPGSLSFLVHEAYADADAFATHMGNLGAQRMAIARKIFIVERMIVSGALPEPLVQQLKSMGSSTYVYGETLSVLAG
jgi:quinol monooxygenase YgiN